MTQNLIGIRRAELVKDNERIIVDQDNIEIKNGVLYTEKQQYQIVKQENLPFESYRYYLNDISIKGGGQRKKIHTKNIKGINRFLTANQEYDKQILKFVKREYKTKYGLQDIDNAELSYAFDNEDVISTQKELKQLYKLYNGGSSFSPSKEQESYSKKLFGVNFSTFQKYKNQVIGANLYVDEYEKHYQDDETRMNDQLFGGCNCELQLFEPQTYSTTNGDSSLREFAYNLFKTETKQQPSVYIKKNINVLEDKLRQIKGGLKGGDKLEEIKIEGGKLEEIKLEGGNDEIKAEEPKKEEPKKEESKKEESKKEESVIEEISSSKSIQSQNESSSDYGFMQ